MSGSPLDVNVDAMTAEGPGGVSSSRREAKVAPPRPRYTPSVLEPWLVTAMSGTMPFAKLAITIPAGVAAVASGEPVAGVKVPSKLLLPSRIETEPETEELPWFTTARSRSEERRVGKECRYRWS